MLPADEDPLVIPLRKICPEKDNVPGHCDADHVGPHNVAFLIPDKTKAVKEPCQGAGEHKLAPQEGICWSYKELQGKAFTELLADSSGFSFKTLLEGSESTFPLIELPLALAQLGFPLFQKGAFVLVLCEERACLVQLCLETRPLVLQLNALGNELLPLLRQLPLESREVCYCRSQQRGGGVRGAINIQQLLEHIGANAELSRCAQ